ncbi:microcystin-dependent protein [Dysgonomonas sp. PFB1-18]|uniref:tail fiber protein n=1 Tax=unclassified Dysgonomonas TaxID=2630389 RepID=UPI002473502B|nr:MULTISPECIES: tail fiber protein [unclassified Dysgonomonas]MDH6309414.1 microcystin-dependent protein [Dysgonomonas sp. PF1-14]MDH6339721.1 microcystin-dependent protein [Dysgonomonas sp. PF1-16]MDH6381369.1 microcystin-dependent protein [Dysgonomonas sp. PFB1-18]MDH6398584.1 microcystin-dependent protein [Dysgonomonas sp. PF1-23]
MNKVNIIAKDDFPMDSDGMDFIQKMIHQVYKLARLGGGDYILEGCNEVGGVVSDGQMVISGELVEFKGGQKQDYIVIIETRETIHDEEETGEIIEYPEAYVSRYATFANDGKLKWEGMKRIVTNQELEERLDAITGDAPGMVKMWAGKESKIPADYILCDGRVLLNNEYPELYEALDGIYGIEGNTGFKIPDMRDRFVVGHNNQNEDYKSIGNKGGAVEITPSVEQLPPHGHKFRGARYDANNWRGTGDPTGSYTVYYDDNSITEQTGEGKPIDIRPPYFVIAYIIKVR